ncbi:MAG TPA: galactokinase family protein [Gaiellales bacterium]
MTDLRTQASDGFAALFGYPPGGMWSAPGRVNLIGEHTDYNEGFVLPFAIDRRTYAALALRDDGLVRVSSSANPSDTGPSGTGRSSTGSSSTGSSSTGSSSTGSSSAGSSSTGSSSTGSSSAGAAIAEFALSAIAPSAVRGWAAYPLGVAWGLGRVGADLAGLPGFDVHFASAVPVGAGLSSSAALEASLAVALNEVWRLGFDRARLVEATHLAENDFVGAPTGILDQSAALLSAEGAALFLDCRDASSSPVDLGLDAAGLAVLVIDTKVNHEHVSGGYAARRAACERAARALGVLALRDVTAAQLLGARARLDDETFRRARHVVTEDQRVLDTVEALRARDHATVGGLMSASHRSMRDDFEISTRELDLAVEVATDGGALGARMTGGGFGGSAIALTLAERIPALRLAVDEAFGERGYRAPETFVVRPSQSARRELFEHTTES